jgi:lipoprotein-releasing system permease protein
VNNQLNKILIKKILFSKSSKTKVIRSAILIILVVALLIVSTIFINSMSLGIATKFSLLVNGEIEVNTTDNLVEKYDFIETSDTVYTISSILYGKNDTQITAVKAVDKTFFNDNRVESLNLELTPNTSNLPSIIISKKVAEKLGLNIGEKAALILAEDETRIRPKLLFIEGLYNSGYKEIDMNLCFMDINELKNILKSNLEGTQEIILKEGFDIKDSLITLNLDGYVSRAWYEIQASVYNNLLLSTQSLLIVFIVIALLTGYFVSSISSDLITKDHKTIAINKLSGLRDSVIKRNYFVSIELFTLVSTLTGIALGIFISKSFLHILAKLPLDSIPALSWYLFDFDIIIPYSNIFIIGFALIFISMLSVFFSLKRIKKIEVLDMLNHE